MPTKQKAREYGLNRSHLEDLPLPSGGFVQVRRPGVDGLVRAGIIDSLDNLSGIVAAETIPTAEGRPPGKAPALTGKQITDALDVMDKVAAYVVVQPRLLPVPADGAERDEDAYYVDDLTLEDKTYLTSFAMGGTRDLETFRAESEKTLGSVPAG